MPRHVDTRPKPWGSHYGAVTTASTGQRNFVDGFAFMEKDGEEGLSWHHIEDVAAYDEDHLERFTARAGEGLFVSEHISGPAYAYQHEDSRIDAPWVSWKSGENKERGFKKGIFGFGSGVKKRTDMRELFRAAEERGSKEGISGSAQKSGDKKGSFGVGAKGKGGAGKK